MNDSVANNDEIYKRNLERLAMDKIRLNQLRQAGLLIRMGENHLAGKVFGRKRRRRRPSLR